MNTVDTEAKQQQQQQQQQRQQQQQLQQQRIFKKCDVSTNGRLLETFVL